MKYALNVKKVVTHLGGPERVAEGLAKLDVKCGIKAVHKWLERNTIPLPRWLALKEMAESTGGSLTLEDFLTVRSGP